MLNQRLAEKWPNINEQGAPLPDAHHWADKPDKLALLCEAPAASGAQYVGRSRKGRLPYSYRRFRPDGDRSSALYDNLFRFRMMRPDTFRFCSGEFVMIGLPNAEKPVFRAYSVASPSWDEELEFYSIKVPGGPLTEHLQKIKEGDTVLMRKKPTGTLVNDALLPGKRLWMFSTGTGFAPCASLIRAPEIYEKFEELIVTHTCREVAELAYSKELVASVKDDPLCGEFAAGLHLYATVTREDFPFKGRITDLMASGKVFDDLGVPPIHPETDRGMIRDSARAYAQDKLMARVIDVYATETTEPENFTKMGLLGTTTRDTYCGLGAGFVIYGLMAREVEAVDGGYRSRMSVPELTEKL